MSKLSKLSGLVAMLALCVSCNLRSNYVQLQGYAQGGTYGVKYNSRGVKVSPQAVQRNVDSILECIDTTLSGYNKNSILSRLNRGESVVMTEMFAKVYEQSYTMWQLSDGAFDVSCGPLYDAWGFGFRNSQLPEQEEIDSLKAICGMHRLICPEQLYALVGQSITRSDLLLTPGDNLTLNFNAIAQGFSCDIVANYLKSLGAEDMLVDIGEIYCCGLNPSGKGWTLGIDNPVDGNNSPGADIADTWTSDGHAHGVVTSGNYRKFYIKDGVKYSHTIDPRTGYPVQHDLLSATVIAPTASQADALATFFMVIGKDKALDWLSLNPEIGACLITSTETVWRR